MRNMADITPDPIVKIAMGFMAAKHLFVANEIGLFESLAAGHSSIAELAKKTAISTRTLGIVANAMVSLGLVSGKATATATAMSRRHSLLAAQVQICGQ